MAAETTDFSPTPTPTARPTHLLTVLQVVQRVDGINIDEVNENSQLFDESFVAGVVAASKISADEITISSVEQAQFSKNAVNVNYLIQAGGTDSIHLSEALTTEDAGNNISCSFLLFPPPSINMSRPSLADICWAEEVSLIRAFLRT